MKANPFVVTALERKPTFKSMFLGLFRVFSSYPRMILEVFIRKNFGYQYFQFADALIFTAILAAWPFLAIYIDNLPVYKLARMTAGATDAANIDATIFPQYLTWYLFLIAFVVVSFRHYKYKLAHPWYMEEGKYTQYSGDRHAFFFDVKLPFGIQQDFRMVECYLEPAGFFIAGIFLAIIGQKLGGLLILCSVFYAMNYVAEYTMGDLTMMTIMDKMLLQESFQRVFIEPAETIVMDGINFRFRNHESQEMRRKIFSVMQDDEDIAKAE